MKICFLYGGQGSQKEKMGYDFYINSKIAKEFYDSAKTEKKPEEYFSMNDENLRRTDNTQMALILYEMAVTKILKEEIKPQAAVGLSIGEYAALNCAGILSDEDTVKIAGFRGKEMYRANNFDSSMCAVLKMNQAEIENICKSVSDKNERVEISNINTVNQIVISGHKNAVEKAVKEIEARNGRTVQLNVQGAFHTSYMKEVEEKLNSFFRNINFHNPEISVYYNLTGNMENENIKGIMAKQVSHCVKFRDIIENLISDGFDTFIEIGFGKIISGFIRKIDRNVKVYSVSDYKSCEQLLKEFK